MFSGKGWARNVSFFCVCVCLRINFVLSYSPLQPIPKSPKDSKLRMGLTRGGGGKVVEGTFNMIYLGLFSS